MLFDIISNYVKSNKFDNANNYFKLQKTTDTVLNDLIEKKAAIIRKFSKFDTLTLNEFNKSFKIITVNTSELLKLFESYIQFFYLDTYFIHNVKLNQKHNYVNIDFEFNGKSVALMQLNFLGYNNGYIFITNPNNFSSYLMKLFLELILQNTLIKKIMHGSESLDMRYIYETLCSSDNKIYKSIMISMYDTRFVCEYSKNTEQYINKKSIEAKCSLYTALLDFNVINNEQHKKFLNLYDEMGPIQDIAWSVTNLGKAQLKYAYYDVVYLRYLYRNILNYSDNKYVKNGLTIIPEFFRLICLEKKGATDIINNAKLQCDPINNYLIKKLNVTMLNHFNDSFEEIKLPNIIPYTFTLITYFKKSCVVLFKKVVYFSITKKYKIYKDKNTEFKNNITMEDTYSGLDKLGYYRILQLLQNIEHSLR